MSNILFFLVKEKDIFNFLDAISEKCLSIKSASQEDKTKILKECYEAK